MTSDCVYHVVYVVVGVQVDQYDVVVGVHHAVVDMVGDGVQKPESLEELGISVSAHDSKQREMLYTVVG